MRSVVSIQCSIVLNSLFYSPSPQNALIGTDGGVKLPKELADKLNQLAQLNNYKNSPVALRARKVLITSSQPSYQLRYNQVESIFISAVEDETFIVSELEVRLLPHGYNDVECGTGLEQD